MKTKWTKRGNEWRRGPLRVRRDALIEWRYIVVHCGYDSIGSSFRSFPSPEAAMRAADKWAAKMLKALLKMEGGK